MLIQNVKMFLLCHRNDKLGHALHAERAFHVTDFPYQIRICIVFAMKQI